MTTEELKSEEKGRASRREAVGAINLGSFCKMFDRGLFSSIQTRAVRTIPPQQSHNDVDLISKTR